VFHVPVRCQVGTEGSTERFGDQCIVSDQTAIRKPMLARDHCVAATPQK
jgi:hypothetical protein